MKLAEFFEQQRGAQAKLARITGIPAPTFSQWAAGDRPIPVEKCVRIERATNGECTCEELNESFAWRRVPDPEWPWHPDGKPLIDPLPAEAEQLAEEVSHG